MNNLFKRSYQLAELMFLASSSPTHVTMIEADSTGHDVESVLTHWAGGIGVDPEPAMYAPWKAYTLLAKGAKKGISKTPIPNFLHGCPYAGALRENQYITSCSGWNNDKVDLLLAALLMYSIKEEVRFHHAGFSYPSEKACKEGMYRSMERFSTMFSHNEKLQNFSETKSKGWYVEVNSELSPNGKFWIEHQYSPQNPTISLHWDIATTNPESLVSYISKQVGEPQYVKRIQDSPSAKIAIMDTNGTEIAIMARPNWSAVEDWK